MTSSLSLSDPDRPHSGRKILIATLGTRGDVQPYVALAAALSRLGAEVVIATGRGFDDMIRAAGATPRSLAIDYQQLIGSADVREALFSLKGKIRVARESMAQQKATARDLWDLTLQERPDLVLFNMKAAAVALAARHLGVPAVPTSLQPALLPTGDYPLPLIPWPDLGRSLNRLSYRVGRGLIGAGLRPVLKPLRTHAGPAAGQAEPLLDGHAPDGGPVLSLQAFSQALIPQPDDWPNDGTTEAWQCGYWFTEPDPGYQPPDELGRFLEGHPAPVYLGFGSMPSRDPDHLTRLVLEVLSGLPDERAILSTGWGGLSAANLPEALRPRVHILDKAPHSWLFPRCAAIVHHGGAGTTHEALRWGKPGLVTPVFADQPFWGARVHAIGAGPAPIPQKKLTVPALSRALLQLKSQRFNKGAEAAAEKIRTEPGADGTARRLMALLSASTPQKR